MLFDEDGWPTTADSPSAARNSYGLPRLTLKERIFSLLDEPPSLYMNSHGQPEIPVEDPAPPCWPDEGLMRVPYAATYRSMIWKPTAVCIDGEYHTSYGDEAHFVESATTRRSCCWICSLACLCMMQAVALVRKKLRHTLGFSFITSKWTAAVQ